MRTCDACGFENAEPGKACALCGASEILTVGSDVSTLVAPPTPSAGSTGAARVAAGQTIGGRYRVVSLLGSGGMGQVFRVRDEARGQELALKVLRPLDGDDADRERRFQREIQILTRIRHPAVLRILDWGESEAGPWTLSSVEDAAPGSGGEEDDDDVVVVLPDAGGTPNPLQIAVLVYLDGAPAELPSVATQLLGFAPDIIYLSSEVEVEPSSPTTTSGGPG